MTRMHRDAAIGIRVLLATACALWTGCRGSNEVSGPAPAEIDLTGSWSGTFVSSKAGCSTPATATFSQKNSNVLAELAPAACRMNGVFHGTLNGQTLAGSAGHVESTPDGLLSYAGTANGTASKTAITLQVDSLCAFLGDSEVAQCREGGILTLTKD
jgi:hypothetical protein